MYSKVFYSSPKRCLFENCRAPFFTECYLGYLPLSPTEVYTVMRCSKCGYEHHIPQLKVTALKYKNELKSNPQLEERKKLNKISSLEHKRMKTEMEKNNPLKTLKID